MITLHLLDAQTGMFLASQPASKLPTLGSTLTILLHGEGFRPLEVMQVTSTPKNEGSLFETQTHWIKCRPKSS